MITWHSSLHTDHMHSTSMLKNKTAFNQMCFFKKTTDKVFIIASLVRLSSFRS